MLHFYVTFFIFPSVAFFLLCPWSCLLRLAVCSPSQIMNAVILFALPKKQLCILSSIVCSLLNLKWSYKSSLYCSVLGDKREPRWKKNVLLEVNVVNILHTSFLKGHAYYYLSQPSLKIVSSIRRVEGWPIVREKSWSLFSHFRCVTWPHGSVKICSCCQKAVWCEWQSNMKQACVYFKVYLEPQRHGRRVSAAASLLSLSTLKVDIDIENLILPFILFLLFSCIWN